MTTTTHFVADLEFRAENSSGNTVDIDMYPKDQKKAFSPTELLLSALSACASVDLVQMLKKRKKTVLALDVTANGIRKEENPRAFIDIELVFKLTSPDATMDEFEKLGKLAATTYCSVSATLNCPVSHRFEITRP